MFKEGDLVWSGETKNTVARICEIHDGETAKVEIVYYSAENYFGGVGKKCIFALLICIPLNPFEIAKLKKLGYV